MENVSATPTGIASVHLPERLPDKAARKHGAAQSPAWNPSFNLVLKIA